MGSALVFVTAFTLAADVSDGGSRGTNMGLVRGGVLFGCPTGVILGGVVSELAGTLAAFAVATAFAAVAGLVAYRSVPETHVEGREPAFGHAVGRRHRGPGPDCRDGELHGSLSTSVRCSPRWSCF